MKKYSFSLEAVRRIRKVERDEQRVRLADAYRAEEIVKQEQAKLQEEILLLREQQRRVASLPELEINAVLAAQRYEIVLNAQKQLLERHAALLAEATDRRQQAVIEADRQVQTMDKLDERMHKAYEAEVSKVEIKELDEVAQLRAVNRIRK